MSERVTVRVQTEDFDPGRELATLEIVYRYVEVLDHYFGNVSPRLPLTAPTQTH